MRGHVIKVYLLVLAAGFAVAVQSQTDSPRFEPARVVATAEAAYPVNAISPGSVVLEVTVGIEGQVEDVKVVRAAPPFTQQALTAIKKWKFAPARLDGQPVRSVVPVAFSFSQPAVWWTRPSPAK